MKTLKIMSIVGLCLAGLAYITACILDPKYDFDAAIGWIIIMVGWTIAQSVVTLVKVRKRNLDK